LRCDLQSGNILRLENFIKTETLIHHFHQIDVAFLLNKIEKQSLGSSYIKSYPSLITFFRKDLDVDALIQGAYMVYGWMPTVLNITKNQSNPKRVLDSVIKLANGPIEEHFNNVIRFTNNSLVGASKLLHFIYPTIYPIWDSKICASITGRTDYKYVQNLALYLDYYKAINEFIEGYPQNITMIQNEFEMNFNYKISKIRGVELVLFFSID
jgi:hypothetical protein